MNVDRERWVTRVEETLRRSGHHRSSARPAVVRALAEAAAPLTVLELETRIRLVGRVGRASIYHALELLCRHALAYRLDCGDGQARYLAAHADGPVRHYLACGRCGAMVELATARLDRAIGREADRLGVAIDARPLVLHGVCAQCRPVHPAR
jgi:Fur family transcriptional regulator, ferric uptake regulator